MEEIVNFYSGVFATDMLSSALSPSWSPASCNAIASTGNFEPYFFMNLSASLFICFFPLEAVKLCCILFRNRSSEMLLAAFYYGLLAALSTKIT